MTAEAHVARLPKGPHDLTRAQVEASQRQRILDAVLDVIGEQGYAATTVAHITGAAGVSRTTFYEQFANKQDAFLVAYDEFGKHFLGELSLASGGSPAEVLVNAADHLSSLGRTRPLACRAFLLEIHAAGEEGLKRRDKMMRLAEKRFQRVSEWLRAIDPELPSPPRLVGRGVVAASWELTAQAVRTKGDTSAETREALAYVWLLGLTGRPAPRYVSPTEHP
jgi:AcrR family transcriptional regulator